MGSKQALAESLIQVISERGLMFPNFIDLFGGSAAVSEVASRTSAVTYIEQLHAPTIVAKAKLLPIRHCPAGVLPAVLALAREELAVKSAAYREEILRDAIALERGYEATALLIQGGPPQRRDGGLGEFHMFASTYSRGYFSVLQALELDALRAAIDTLWPESLSSSDEISARELLLGSLVVTVSRTSSSPGHTAQFLNSTHNGFPRLRSIWTRSCLQVFSAVFEAFAAESATRQGGNKVIRAEARDHMMSRQSDGATVFYADPPYTKDQYSRFYHLLESAVLYDYPVVHGQGRARADRATSRFSLASSVEEAIRELGAEASQLGAPLALSYPRSGLLHSRGKSPQDILVDYGDVECVSLSHEHSSLGARSGRSSSPVDETLTVMVPR
jgi:adenine-specific DNA-methyltransferase